MGKRERENEREKRIFEEIMPDAFGDQEEAISWHNYLSDTLEFPFSAKCIEIRVTSPLKVGDKVKVLEMAEEEECEHEMFVLVRWKSHQIAVPLAQLEGMKIDEETTGQAIEDWRYWVDRGHRW